MKKSLFLVFAALGGMMSAQKFEVSASAGSGSVQGIGYSISNDIVSVVLGGNPAAPDPQFTATVGAMMYSDNQKWRYGLDFVYEGFEKTEQITKQSLMSVLPKIDYMWLKPGNDFQLYSGVGLGLTTVNTTFKNKNTLKEEKESDAILGYNITPIGVRYGKAFGVFIETNIGNKGLVNGGFSYKF